MSDPRFAALDALVRDHRHFVLTTHVNPDGDGLGSEVALALWLRGLGKQVTVFNDGRMPHNFAFLGRHCPIETFTAERAEQVFGAAEVVIVVDMQSKDRLGRLAPYVGRPGTTVVILDHHVGDTAFGQLNIVDPEKAATGELIFDFLARDPAALTTAVAEALYTALVTDTGSFRHSNTDPDVHRMAARLLEAGVESARVQAWIHEYRNFGRLHFVGHMLLHMRTTDDGTVAWFEITPDLMERFAVEGPDSEGLVDFPRTVPGVEAVMLLTQQPEGRVKASLRSSGRVDVNRVAQSMGGGGHRFAAGVTLDGTLESARARLLGALAAAVAALDPNAVPYARATGS